KNVRKILGENKGSGTVIDYYKEVEKFFKTPKIYRRLVVDHRTMGQFIGFKILGEVRKRFELKDE
ncbi:MAG: hypothetical protein Q7K42_04200, partial [Candidatus Diapherotrites archaeon]|nr:hypothetical protein [Candidatus Diapherotrites archaeon]